MRKIGIGGRSFVLAFNMFTMDKIEEACKGKGDLYKFATENFTDPHKLIDVLPALLSGNNEDVPNARWFKANLTVGKITALLPAVMEEFIESMKMDLEEEKDEPVDIVMEEIRKKDKADG